MLTRLKLKRGEGNLVVSSPQVRSSKRREQLPQSPPQISPQVAPEALEITSHEGELENMLEYEKDFRKSFFDMTKMVKVLYEERNTRLQGESSNPQKGDKNPRGDGDKLLSLKFVLSFTSFYLIFPLSISFLNPIDQ